MRLRVLTLCLDWRRESFHSMSANWRIHVIYITQGRKQWPRCIWCLIFAVYWTAFRVTKEIPLAVPLRGLPESFNWREESPWMLVYHSMVWGPGQNQRKKIYIYANPQISCHLHQNTKNILHIERAIIKFSCNHHRSSNHQQRQSYRHHMTSLEKYITKPYSPK